MGIHDVDRTLPSNQLIFDVRRDMQVFQRFKQNMEPFFEKYGLSDGEKAAWRAEDIGALSGMGVHPYFLPQVSRMFHGSAYNHNRSEAAQVYAKNMLKGEAGDG